MNVVSRKFFVDYVLQLQLQLKDRSDFDFSTKCLLSKGLIVTIFRFLGKCLLNIGFFIGVLTVFIKKILSSLSLLRPLKCVGTAHVTPSQTKSTNFEFMIATDTDKPIINKNIVLPLKNTIYDNTIGSIVDRDNHSAFIAPVDGLYRFELQVQWFFRNLQKKKY